MQLFYSPVITTTETSFVFDKEESKHIIKVLRKKDNDTLYVTNGLGFLFETKITLASDSRCTVAIVSNNQFEKPKQHLHIAIAPTKMNERFEWFLEKATEIGVQEITPIICDNSERKIIKTERFEKIILSAMKQSNQYFLPKLNEAVLLKDFVASAISGQKYIAHCEETDRKDLKTKLSPTGNITILIGPEGDFSAKEIKLAIESQYVPVSLGATRLRTETAGIVACHTVAIHI